MLKGESLKSLLKELRWEKSVKKKKKKIGDVKKTGVSINSCLYHEYASIVTKIFKWFTKNPHIQK